MSSRVDFLMIRDHPYSEGEYYRVDFAINSVLRSGGSARLYACGDVSEGDGHSVGWEIRETKLPRLLNFLVYVATMRRFSHFGFLLRMARSLAAERPDLIVFHSHWTGLFLLFWRKFAGLKATLIWDWYDLRTRTEYYRRKMRLLGKLFLRLEERIAPAHFEGLIVPTMFARRLLKSWGHPSSKIHVLGEVRELNPYVDLKTLERRAEDIRNGHPLQVIWIGVVRAYQLDGLVRILDVLRQNPHDGHKMIIHAVGPSEAPTDEVRRLGETLPAEITFHWHGSLSRRDMDRVLAGGHVAIHPIPHELFSGFIFSRKMADYLAAALPVAFTAVGGLSEIGERFGVPFSLHDSASASEALRDLSVPKHYQKLLSRAWEAAHEEYSIKELERKGSALVDFLREISAGEEDLLLLSSRL